MLHGPGAVRSEIGGLDRDSTVAPRTLLELNDCRIEGAPPMIFYPRAVRLFTLCLATMLLAVGFVPPMAAAPPKLLPESCETDLALSAAPDYLREKATLYLLREEGYVKAREGSNPFTCIVNRDHPKVLKPTCFDAEGAATIVPKILHVGRRMMEGVEIEMIREEVSKAFEKGTFVPARRPGVAYMLSRYNRPYNPNTGKLDGFRRT